MKTPKKCPRVQIEKKFWNDSDLFIKAIRDLEKEIDEPFNMANLCLSTGYRDDVEYFFIEYNPN